MSKPQRIQSALKHPRYPLYVLVLWVVWMIVRVVPTWNDERVSTLLLTSLGALLVYALPVALVIVIVMERE